MTLTVEGFGTTRVTSLAKRPGTALVLVGLMTGLLAACADSPEKRDEKTMASAGASGPTNVPVAPSVDRSKCSDKGKQVVTTDTNLDKKPDVWKFFTTVQQGGQTVSVLSCKQVDLNHDGKIDIVYYYDESGSQAILEEADLDRDGQFDQTTYYVGGKKVRREEDTNLDNRSDVWTYYEDEKIVRVERDTDFNGKVDEWQYYEGGKLDRIGYDTTGTGRLDRWDRAPEGETPGGEAGGGTPAAPPSAPAPGPSAMAPPPVAPPPVAPAPLSAPAATKTAKK